jgi:hypothetical protein
MVLLALELAGNATVSPSYTFTLDHALTYSRATLCAVDLHAPSPGLVESWTSAQTGDDYPVNRTAYAPLYADIGGIADNGHVHFYTSHNDDGEHPRHLVPIGDAKTGNHSLRSVNIPLFVNADGATVTREVGYNITVSLYYRSVETGSLGDILPLPANVSDGEGGTTYGAWTHDSRCTLYIDLQ